MVNLAPIYNFGLVVASLSTVLAMVLSAIRARAELRDKSYCQSIVDCSAFFLTVFTLGAFILPLAVSTLTNTPLRLSNNIFMPTMEWVTDR